MIFNRMIGGGGKTTITLASAYNPTPQVVTQDGQDYLQYTVVKSDT